MIITSISVYTDGEGMRKFNLSGTLQGREELDLHDITRIEEMVHELNGGGSRDTDPEPEEKPKTRRGKKGKDEKAEEKPKTRRGRKDPEPEDPVDEDGDEDAVTDADLMKQVTRASQELTPAVVKEVVAEYATSGKRGKASVSDIPDEDRQEFIDKLEGMIAQGVDEDEGEEEEEEEQPTTSRRGRRRR